MNKLLQKVAKIFLGLSMAAGVGVAIGSNGNDSSPVYAASPCEITLSTTGCTATGYDSGQERTWTQDGTSFGAVYLMKSSSNMQFQKTNAKVYNTTAMSGTITGITLTVGSGTARNWSLKLGTARSNVAAVSGYNASSTGWSSISGSYTFFEIHSPASGASYLSKISISYSSGYTVTKNATNCTITGDTTVDGSANASYTIVGTGTYVAPETVTVQRGSTTLTPTTHYSYYTTDGTGYLTIYKANITGNLTITASGRVTYSVTGSITNGSLSPTDRVASGNYYEGTITPSSGYSLPDSITVTRGGVDISSSEDVTYLDGDVVVENVTGNLVITAVCVAQGTAYTVTYNANSGSVSPASEQIVENGHPSFPTPTRSGYNFKGWQVNGSGTAYTDPEDYTVTGDVTFVASWAAVYTVTFSANGGSSTPASKSIEYGSTFTFPSAGTKTHYSFSGWKSPSDSNLYAVGATSPAVTAAITYTAQWTPDAQYDVTYTAGDGGSGSFVDEDQWSGSYTLKAFANLTGVSASSGYRFKNYTVGGVAKNPGDTVTLSAATAVTVNFELIPPSDTLTATLIGRTSYGDWSGVSPGASDAVYAGNSTKSTNAGAIQMRSSNSNSGIVTTTSGGTIASITVTWNTTEAPTTARTLDIYAKTTAYSAATDLYSSGTQGTKVGSLSYTNTTTYESTFTFTGDYTYVGVRSNNGALYLDDITFEWELPNQLSSIVISGYEDEFDSGDTFSFGGTVTAKYTKASDATVTSSATFHLDSASGTSMTGVTLTHAAHDGHTIYVKYTEDGVTKTATYEISVANAPVSSVTITIHAAEIGLEEDYSVSGIEPTVLPADAVKTTEWVVSANTVSNDYTWDGTKLTSGNTEGTVTLRCRSTADNSKYDEIVVDITGDPVAEFAKDSTSGYAGKSETVSFIYGNFDAEDIVIASGNTSYVTIGTVSAEHGSGSVVINFVAAGSTSVTIGDGNSTLDTLTVTVNANNVASVTWSATDIDVFSGETLSTTGWNVQYHMDSGDTGSAVSYTIKLGSATITAGYEFKAEDNNKTMHVEYGGVSSSSITVTVTQSIHNVNAPTIESNTVSWTATAAANLGSAISSEGGTDSGTISTGDYSWNYTRTLTSLASGKSDNISWQGTTWIQLGSNNSMESIVFTTSSIPGTITSVSVVVATAGSHELTIDVGGTKYLENESLHLYSGTAAADNPDPSDCVETGTGTSSGAITITIAPTAATKKAMVIRSISVTYETATGTPANIANNASHKAAQRAAVAFAQAFNAAMDETENCTTGLDAAWSICSSAYTSFKNAAAALGSTEEAYALNLVKYATAQYSDDSAEACIERMMKTYEICVQKHGKTAFMDDLVTLDSAHISPLINIVGEKANSVAIIVIISMVSVTAIGGYFFLRKRKGNI